MPLKGFLINGNQETFDDAMMLALRGETNMSLPVMASIVASTLGKGRPGPDAGFSASQFSACARKVMLERWEDYWVTPEDLYAMSRGTLIHKVLEDAVSALPAKMKNYFQLEERLHSTVSMTLNTTGEIIEQKVHGQYDLAYLPMGNPEPFTSGALPDQATLYDHKNTQFIQKQAKPEHVAQVSIYAWLLGKNNWPRPLVGRITYMDNAHSVVYDVKLWSDDTVEVYLEDRLQDLVLAERSHVLPARVEEEGRWACGANKTKKSYCPFSATCWPDGIGTPRDGWTERYFTRGGDEGEIDDVR